MAKKESFKLREDEVGLFLYDNSRKHKTKAEILEIMKKEANGKPFAYGIYNG